MQEAIQQYDAYRQKGFIRRVWDSCTAYDQVVKNTSKKSLLHSASAYNVTSFTEALFKKKKCWRALQFLLVLFFNSFHL